MNRSHYIAPGGKSRATLLLAAPQWDNSPVGARRRMLSTLDRRAFLRTAAAAAVAAPERRPNVLFILADQWRAQTLGAAGDPDLRAPNLDRLAREGLYFSRACASYPLCTPSRASLLTGRFPHACRTYQNNIQLPLDEVCIGGVLSKEGYATGYIGKWHLDGEAKPGFVPPGPRRRGFDYWAAFNRGHEYFDPVYFRDTGQPIRPGGFEPDYQTGLAADFIHRNRTGPFCLFLSWGPPHTPRKPPPKYARLYDPRQFRLRENVPELYEEKARAAYAGYYGLCSALDDNLGRLLKVLDEEAVADDTIVIFTADHGDMLGSHGLEFKNVPYEESARIPLLMRYPRKLRRGGTLDFLVSAVDYMPTLLSMCGAEAPRDVQGRDLAGLILDGAGERPESLYAEGRLRSSAEWRMIVRGADKMVVNSRLEVTHLYNLSQDPFEMTNLAGEAAATRKRDELKALLRTWILRTSDRLAHGNPIGGTSVPPQDS